jgi:hypothetical protein
MAAIAKLLSRAFPEADQRSDDIFPVLMFSVIGLLMSICFVLVHRTPMFLEFQVF